MANLKKQHQAIYYQSPDLYGNYQFVSLHDIINHFMIVYTGDEKILNKVSKTDVAFFAQRGLAEMSFDTFKSIKSQQIDLPASLQMILPHDYVNYTKVSFVDSAGIKHPLYPTKHTNNPFQPLQDASGAFEFPAQYDLLDGIGLFDYTELYGSYPQTMIFQTPWESNNNYVTPGAAVSVWTSQYYEENLATWSPSTIYNAGYIENSILNFIQAPLLYNGQPSGSVQAIWKKIDVSELDEINLTAFARTSAAVVGTQVTTGNDSTASGSAVTALSDGTAVSSTPFYTISANNHYALNSGTDDAGAYPGPSATTIDIPNIGAQTAVTIPATTVTIGFSTVDPSYIEGDGSGGLAKSLNPANYWTNDDGSLNQSAFDLASISWTAGEAGTKTDNNINVSNLDEIYIIVTSEAPWTDYAYGESPDTLFVKTFVDSIEVTSAYSANNLYPVQGQGGNSSTWDNYKSQKPSENTEDDYQDDIYWPSEGERYGLDPAHAQVNGSFYIDELRGKINFSSNISGKTVILDYISDSLGSNSEMQVHKLAEDAMYKYILCELMSTRRGVGRGQLAMYKKDKFAAIRKAKLRLSNIKLEEITQILRGKSKQIKH